MIRLHRLYALIAVAVLSACATGPGGESRFDYSLLDEPESGLAYAVRFASELQDAEDRAQQLFAISQHYEELSNPQEARALRDFSYEAILASEDDAPLSATATELAAVYFEQGRTDRTAALLELAVERISEHSSPLEQARVLEQVIELSFEGGDELFDVLRVAIEAVFVIEDLNRRVEILVDAVVRYQERGIRQTANSLIQQAIPAAGNISEPWKRAAAYTAIARAYRAMEEGERAQRMVDDAISAVEGAEALPAEAAGDFLVRLVELDYRAEALDLAERVDRPASRAVVLARLAETYDTEALRSSAFILYSSAASAAGRVEEAGDRARSYTRIAESYMRFGETQLAVIQASNAVRTLTRVDSDERDREVMEKLVEVLTTGGATEEIATLSELADSAEGEARLSAYIAVSTVGLDEEFAAQQLERAQDALESLEGSQNKAGRDIAIAAARLGRIDEALSQITTMRDARRISEAVVVLGVETMRGDGLSDEQRSRLEEFFREYRQRQRLS